ncbi:hypothetical protein D3C75_1320990 [compost metagenome]
MGPIARILAASAQQTNSAPAHTKNRLPVARRPAAKVFSPAPLPSAKLTLALTITRAGQLSIIPKAAIVATAMMITNGIEVV